MIRTNHDKPAVGLRSPGCEPGHGRRLVAVADQQASRAICIGDFLRSTRRSSADDHLRTRRPLRSDDNLLAHRRHLLQRREGPQQGVHAYYGEFSPRLSLRRILDRRFELGPIKDVLLALTYENGEDDSEAYLIGPVFDLAVPGFNFFTLNFSPPDRRLAPR